MSNEQAPAAEGARKRNILDEYKLRIVGDVQVGGSKPALLAPLTIANQVRFRAWSGIPDADGRDWLLEAKMDAATAYALVADLKNVVANREFGRRAIACKTGRDPIVADTTIVYGRDQDKSIFIGLVSADKSRKLQFILRPTEYHDLSGADGRSLDPVTVSEWFTNGWILLMENLIASAMAVSYTDRMFSDPDTAPKSAPSGGGWKGNGGGGYQQRQGGWKGNGGGGGNWKSNGGNGGGWKGNGGGNWKGNGGGGYQQRQGGGGYQQKSQGGYSNPNRDHQPETAVFDDDVAF